MVKKRARSLNLDLNLLSIESLHGLHSILTKEKEKTTGLKEKLTLLMQSRFIGCILKERTAKGEK